MEQIGKALLRLNPDNLAKDTQNDLSLKVTNEISIYKTELLTSECMAIQSDRILSIYPELKESWFDILEDMLEEDGWGDKKYIDAVTNFLKTNVYNQPKPAHVLNYDKTVKIYNYHEAIEYGMKYLGMINIGLENPRWVLKEHIEQFSLIKWEN